MGIRRKPEGVQVTSPAIHPELTASHYTRVVGPGEAVNRANGTPRARPDAATHQTKETIMIRMFTTAAILALSLSAAQAETGTPLSVRIHDAAVTACAPERVSGTAPRAHYGAIEDQCVYRLSQSAMAKYQGLAKSGAATRLANN
jgi:hypothetical protein